MSNTITLTQTAPQSAPVVPLILQCANPTQEFIEKYKHLVPTKEEFAALSQIDAIFQQELQALDRQINQVQKAHFDSVMKRLSKLNALRKKLTLQRDEQLDVLEQKVGESIADLGRNEQSYLVFTERAEKVETASQKALRNCESVLSQ